jgi:hypothetical protein
MKHHNKTKIYNQNNEKDLKDLSINIIDIKEKEKNLMKI